MRNPIFIAGDRGTGKTVKAIAEAEAVGGLVVVANKMMVDFTRRLASDHNILIQAPATHAEYFYGDRYRAYRGPVIIDDADILFRSFITQRIPNIPHMLTFNVDFDRYMYLAPRKTSTLDQLIAYRKTLPTYETVVPIMDLWELQKENENLRRALNEAKERERQAVTMLGTVLQKNQGDEDA